MSVDLGSICGREQQQGYGPLEVELVWDASFTCVHRDLQRRTLRHPRRAWDKAGEHHVREIGAFCHVGWGCNQIYR